MAADSFLGWATVGLGVATLLIALFSSLALREAHADRILARETLAAQSRPVLLQAFPNSSQKETVAVHAPDAMSAYGSVEAYRGQPIVMAGTPFASHACICSVVVRNGGRGPAEILSARLMSLDTLPEGGGPQYVEARPRVNVLAVGDWTRVNADLLPEAPAWFWRTVKNLNRLWLEVTYSDLDRISHETKWFELMPHPVDNKVWRLGAVRSGAPGQTS
jgi:hypothetical protein